jgi:hypothetical protein
MNNLMIRNIENTRLRVIMANVDEYILNAGVTGTKYEQSVRAIVTEMLKKYDEHAHDLKRRGVDHRKSKAFNEVEIENQKSETREKLLKRRSEIQRHFIELSEKEKEKIKTINDHEFSDNREIEMRKELKKIKPLELAQIYLNANRDGSNPLLVQAVEGAPEPFTLVSNDGIRSGKDLRIERESPGVLAELKAIKKAEELSMMIIDAVDKAI